MSVSSKMCVVFFWAWGPRDDELQGLRPARNYVWIPVMSSKVQHSAGGTWGMGEVVGVWSTLPCCGSTQLLPLTSTRVLFWGVCAGRQGCGRWARPAAIHPRCCAVPIAYLTDKRRQAVGGRYAGKRSAVQIRRALYPAHATAGQVMMAYY